MERKVLSLTFGSVMLIFFIMLSIRVQIGTIEGMNQVSAETNQRLGYKAAGSLHIATQGEEFGVLKEEKYREIKQSSGTGCTSTIPGFSINEPLRIGDQDCGEVEKPLSIPMKIKTSNGFEMVQMTVGETSEGFN